MHSDFQRFSDFCVACLTRLGVSEEDGRIQADVLLFAQARGIESHGFGLLPSYVANIEMGAVEPGAVLVRDREAAAFAVLDAGNGLGAVAAHKAMLIGVEKAGVSGVASVSVRNSNHFGAAAYYALLGAERGFVTEICSNAPPMMAPTGGRKRVLGNNPLAIAVPTGPGRAMVVDMALSTVSAGRIINAAAAGASIPEGWLMGPDGRASTDPGDYHRGGALVALGDHKGYALALAIEALAGGLSGAGMASEVHSFRRTPELASHTGHFIRLTAVEAFMPETQFFERMADLERMMQEAEPVDDDTEIMMPGTRSRRIYERSLVEGIAVSPVIDAGLAALGERLGVAWR